MKQKIEKLVNELMKAKIIKGQCSYCGEFNEYETNEIALQTVMMRPEISHLDACEIWRIWKLCGDKSLQEIIAESGYKQEWDDAQIKTGMNGNDLIEKFVLKNPDAQNLINYLLTIFK